MKIQIIGTEQGIFPAVNWDKVQVLRYGNNLILSTGVHTDEHFEGIHLITGAFSNSFLKSFYQLVPPTEKIVVELQNEE
jgi:hypothetical protein